MRPALPLATAGRSIARRAIRAALVGVLVGTGVLASGPRAPSTAHADDAQPLPGQGAAIRAREAATAKRYAEALPLFFQAIRDERGYDEKYALRDEVLALPPVPAPAITPREAAVVAARIAEERVRDVTRKAGDLERKGMIRASRLLRTRLKALEGVAPAEVEALERDVDRIDKAICDDASKEEKEEAKALEGEAKDVEGALARAAKAGEGGKGRVALRVYQAVTFSGLATQEQKDRARDAATALRAKMTTEIDDDEKKAAEAIWEDPHWKGISTSASFEFIYIGAKAFVESISDSDRIHMDLASIFLSDLVGRNMTEDGERLTIYYKERFDFGGGIGGGKRIDIGNKAIGKPIAGPLHYHELSHCVFDVGLIYRGFIEGIANFGAAFALDALGRGAECDAAIKSNRDQFEADWLGRRIAYWRIQSYGPSCGFWLIPVPGRGEAARRPVWAKYREFFRVLRVLLPQEVRDAERIRYFAYYWGETFGQDVVDGAEKARFPVARAERDRVKAELESWKSIVDRAENDVEQTWWGVASEALEGVMKGCHVGELRDRAKFALAATYLGLERPADAEALWRELGVVPRWKLALPFYSRAIPPMLAVFEPERAIDLDKEYPHDIQSAHWVDAKVAKDGRVDLLDHGVGYPDDATAYALAYVEVPAEVPDATLYVGFDDQCAAWVNGELIEKWDEASGWVRDFRVGRAPLRAGRNRLLLKIVNRTGAWGFSARLVRADRSPIAGLAFVDPPRKDFPPTVLPDAKAKTVYAVDFEKTKSMPKGKLKPTVGQWQVVDKALRRTDPGNVLWLKFLVQPYLDKDPPSGLIWLTDKELMGPGDVSVEVTMRLPREGVPRLGVTLHGEGRDDGQSGHTFLVSGGGEGVVVRLEEYDRPVFQGTRPISKGAEHVYRFVRRGRTLACFVDDVPVLDAIDLPPLARDGIGLMTWDKDTGIVRIRVDRSR